MKKFSFKKLGKFFVAAGLVACCLTLSACAGMPKDLLDEIENNPDLSEEEKEQLKEDLKGGISLNGVKVLRKPLTYDFTGDGSWNEGDTDFYHHFAEDLMSELFYIYGNFNSNLETEYQSRFQYYKDQKLISEQDKAFWGDLSTDFQKNKESYKHYYDAFRYPIASESEVKQMVDTGTSEGQVEQVVGYEVTIDQNRAWNWTLDIGDGVTDGGKNYQPWAYKFKQDDYSLFNYQYAFENLGYSYLDFNEYYSERIEDYKFSQTEFSTAYINNNYIDTLTYAVYSIVLGLPTGNIQVNVNTENGIPDVTINNMTPQDALSEVKATYNRLGTYVGLTDNDKAGVIDFIHHNIIGDEAWSGGQNALYDLQYDSIVPALVRYCSTLTQIGKTDGFEGENDENSTIGDPFMASEIADFPATSFFSSMDGDPFEYSEGAFDYQSMVLMPSRDNVELTDITPTGQYIDIEVAFRWYKGDGVAPAEVKRTIRVYDGPPDVGEDNTTLECELDTADGFGDAVKINKFIEPTALKTDKEHNYTKTIKGTDEARKYYTVVQSGSYNAYGVLDYTKIEGSYLEIAFNVKKTAGSDKNYNFSVAISNLMEKGGNQDEHIVD